MNIAATVKLQNGSNIFIITDFFETALDAQLFALFRQFSTSNADWQQFTEFAHQRGRYTYAGHDPVNVALAQFAGSPVMTDCIQSLVGHPVKFLNHDFWCDQAGYEITPHYDLAPFEYAIQIYMTDPLKNFEMMGTAFYEDNTDKLLLEIPYKRNSGYLLDSCHTVWHGLHHAIPAGFDRYSVYLRYKKDEK